MPVVHEHALRSKPSAVSTADQPTLLVENLRFSYPDGRQALRDVSLQINRCEKVALVGPNGAGKSTLMLHLNGIFVGNGHIQVAGLPVTKPNLPLIRKYFKKANPYLKAILLKGLSRHPTDVDLLDDLAYFSEFDSMLGELICFYREACLLETDMERFSVLVQDFHLNTFEQGYDALHELSALFTAGEKGAVVRHLCTTINEYGRSEALPF